MTPSGVGRVLLAPLREPAVAFAGALFWLLGAAALAVRALFANFSPLVGLIGFGIVAAFALPAVVRYLLGLVEAGAYRRHAPVPAYELFQPFSRIRRLLPLVLCGALIVLATALQREWPQVALPLSACLALLLLPPHLVLLAITDSPLQSMHPVALARLLVRLWPGWLWLPALVLPLAAVAAFAASPYLRLLLLVYGLLAVAMLCGALAGELDVAKETDIPLPATPDPDALDARRLREREAALNHAYGLASRGNRDGGFAHLAQYAATQADPLDVRRWFFERMLRWNLADTPLYFAQSLLTALLDAGDERAALKVLLRCLHENPQFRPLAADRERLIAAAARLGNDDLQAALRR